MELSPVGVPQPKLKTRAARGHRALPPFPTFEPAIANAIPATSGPSEGNTEVMAGTPSIWSPAVRGTWSVSGIVMSLSRKNFCACFSFATARASV